MATRQIKALLYDVYDNAGNAALNPTVPFIDASGGTVPTSPATGTMLFNAAGEALWRNGSTWVQISTSTPEVTLTNTVPASAATGTVILDYAQQKPVWYTGSKWATLGTVATTVSSYAPSASDSRIVSWFDAKSLDSIYKSSATAVVASNMPNLKSGGAGLTFGAGTVARYRAAYRSTTGYDVSGLYVTSVANSWIDIPYSIASPGVFDYCLVMACTMDNQDGGNWMSIVKSDGTVHFAINKSRLTQALYWNGSVGSAGSFGIPSPNYPTVLVVQITQNVLQISMNGLVIMNGYITWNTNNVVVTQRAFSKIRLFNDPAATGAHTGHLFEVITFNTVIGDTERQKLEGYLAHKWKFNSRLVGGHPYRIVPPTM